MVKLVDAESFAFTNISMQSVFREWVKRSKDGTAPEGIYIDYAGLDFLAELNANLKEKFDDDALIAQMERNLSLARDLKLEIIAEANRSSDGRVKQADAPVTAHLDETFELMRDRTAAQPPDESE